ncbi:MAG: hypothetical protein PUF72_06050 [Clostridiales bacterium]|nr:hypothetical protein [Clostridiales bacterium]
MITDSILTPIIYMMEGDAYVEFICFCDSQVTFEELYVLGEKVSEYIDMPAEILDIREYDLYSRIDVISNAEMIYAQDPIVSQIFAEAIFEDYRKDLQEKINMLNRKHESGTYYIQ